MIGGTLLAAVTALVTWAPAAPARTELSVMTWNVCAGTNPVCGLYRAADEQLAWHIGQYAVDQPIKPDIIFLQEFCGGAAGPLELRLERSTGRGWSVRSWALTSADGTPYPCHPDRLGRPRGAQSIAVAVADEAVTFETLPLATPPWYVRRAVLCATIPARRIRACGAHLSSGTRYDDRQPGAPYRTRQIEQLMTYAARPGHRVVFGGDLNVAPPDSDTGAAAGRRAAIPAYRAYQECDQPATGRTGRWTYTGNGGRKKLDYLFAAKGSVRQCHTPRLSPLSDHRPLYLKIAL